MSKASDMIRTEFKKGDEIRDAGLTTPEDILRYDNIAYGADPKQQSLDVYRPKAEKGKILPVIVNVHGGGWVYGDKELYQFYCMNLAQRGFAVVNFTYRLAPEVKFPASLEDTNSAFAWVLENAEKYGLDTEHIFAVGDSAGGHLLGLYSCICTNPEYAAKYRFQPPKGFVPKAVALNCGVYEISMGPAADAAAALTQSLMEDVLPEKGTDAEMDLMCVLKHITPDFPPAYVMTSNDDLQKPQAPLLAAKLLEQGVPFKMCCYGNQNNLLPHVFHCNIKTKDAKLCNDEECDFFRKFL